MPARLIKESIWTSPNLNALSVDAERHFYRLLPCPDDFGCFECTPKVIKGKCYPMLDDITAELIDRWQSELEDNTLIFRWDNSHRQYAIFPTFSQHQYLRSFHQRKTPPPPTSIIDRCNTLANTCQQTLTGDSAGKQLPDNRSIPNPILIPNHNPIPNIKGVIGVTKENITFMDFLLSLREKYSDLNLDDELEKFILYWGDGKRILKRPRLAFRNWVDRARQFKQGQGNGQNSGNNQKSESSEDAVAKYTGGKYGHMVQR